MSKTFRKARRFEKRKRKDEEDMKGFLRSRQKHEAAQLFHFNSYDRYLDSLESWDDGEDEEDER